MPSADHQKSITVPLDEVLRSENFKQHSYTIRQRIGLEEQGFSIISPIEIKLTLMKMKEGIHASINSLKCTINFVCVRCLNHSDKKNEIKAIERIYYFETPPTESSDPFDIFLVDKKHLQIDLYEFIRQEILLHFSSAAVCSPHCKGLCPHCGKGLNKSKCSCKTNEADTFDLQAHKPLSKLKDLFKNI